MIRTSITVHKPDCVRHRAVRCSKRTYFKHWALFGEIKLEPSAQMVDLAGPSKLNPPEERKRHPRHSTWPSIRTSTTSIWTNLWLHHSRIIGSIKTRETSQECTIKDELGKSLSTSIRNRQHVVISNGTQQIEKLSLWPSVLSHGTEEGGLFPAESRTSVWILHQQKNSEASWKKVSFDLWI